MGRTAERKRLGAEGQPFIRTWTAEDITAARLRTRRAQGLPDKITDPAVLDTIARLMLPTYRARLADAEKPNRQRRRRGTTSSPETG
jgi:hypothetical protein